MDVVSPDHQDVFFALKSLTKSVLYLTVDEANLSNCSKKTLSSPADRGLYQHAMIHAGFADPKV